MRKFLLVMMLVLCAGVAAPLSLAAARPSGDPLAELQQLTSSSQKLWNDTQAQRLVIAADLSTLNTDSLALLVPSKHQSEVVAVTADIAKVKKDCAALLAADRVDRKKLVAIIKVINKDPAARAQLGAMLTQARQQLAASDANVSSSAKQVAKAVAQAWNPVLPTTDPNAPAPAPGLTA